MQRALNPRLIGISGPVEGALFGLADDDISIGRDASNLLVIDDSSIAACHCRILRQTGDEFAIHDSGSCGATSVNGLPVTERVLQHGDDVRMGNCRFLFFRWDQDVPPGPASTTIGRGPEHAGYCVQPERLNCSYLVTAAPPEGAAA